MRWLLLLDEHFGAAQLILPIEGNVGLATIVGYVSVSGALWSPGDMLRGRALDRPPCPNA